MPTYEYKCLKCGVFDHDQKLADHSLTKCPKCGGHVKRLISSAGIVFKGSGFHVTDYRKDKLHETKPAGKLPEMKTENKAQEKARSEKTKHNT